MRVDGVMDGSGLRGGVMDGTGLLDSALDGTGLLPGAVLLRVAADGLHREAATAASLLRLLPPGDAAAGLLRGRALVLAGRPEAALRAFARVPPDAGDDAPARAAALRLLGRWDLAERCLDGSAERGTEWAVEGTALALDRGEPVLGRTAQQWARTALAYVTGDTYGPTHGPTYGHTDAGTDACAADLAHARCLLAAAYAAAGLFGAALDAADEAAQALDRLGEDAALRRLDAVHRLADALFRTGRRHAAERRLEEALVRARESAQEEVAGRLELGLARARLAAEDLASAGRWAERAAATAYRTGAVPLAVDAELCLARVRLAAGDGTAALAAAESAARAAHPLGGVWRDRAAARLREVRMVQDHEPPVPARSASASASASPFSGHVPESPAPHPLPPAAVLSRREAQVAVLVSEGCTNQQIAVRLQVSPKTVETHLSRIFKKLAITSRAQVAHWVGRGAGPAPDGGGRRSGAGQAPGTGTR
ncbi:helix-turn-helix transcriptional regulator [Streptomyces sp. NPDC047017]|uniref:helix-turn-helix transcriptional regulator n=1 Tax=Streptomyces sp. NPDC047017 TaxID=3155024 RepID=UPI0033D479DA